MNDHQPSFRLLKFTAREQPAASPLIAPLIAIAERWLRLPETQRAVALEVFGVALSSLERCGGEGGAR